METAIGTRVPASGIVRLLSDRAFRQAVRRIVRLMLVLVVGYLSFLFPMVFVGVVVAASLIIWARSKDARADRALLDPRRLM